MHTTLLAVTGLSPAVVTETIWALAREKPRVIPHSVGFITTAAGAAALENALHAPVAEWGGRSVWQGLREAVAADRDELIAEPPRVIQLPDPSSGRSRWLDDIRSPSENRAAAEFILSEVWNVVRDRDRQLVASIAGGRKTMGALLHAAVSLIGRQTDRLTHVLVDPPFDTLSGFFFPGQPGGPLLDRAGAAYAPDKVRVALADVPFVPLRNRFRDLDDLPGSFEGLRRELTIHLTRDAERPAEIVIRYRSSSEGVLNVDGIEWRLRIKALVILHFLLERQAAGEIFPGQIEAANAFPDWAAHRSPKVGALTIDPDAIRHELSYIRTRLRRRHSPWIPPVRSLDFPAFHLLTEDALAVSSHPPSSASDVPKRPPNERRSHSV